MQGTLWYTVVTGPNLRLGHVLNLNVSVFASCGVNIPVWAGVHPSRRAMCCPISNRLHPGIPLSRREVSLRVPTRWRSVCLFLRMLGPRQFTPKRKVFPRSPETSFYFKKSAPICPILLPCTGPPHLFKKLAPAAPAESSVHMHIGTSS